METEQPLRHMTRETDPRHATLVRVFSDLIFETAAKSETRQVRVLDVGSFAGNLTRDIEQSVRQKLTAAGVERDLMFVALDPMYQSAGGLTLKDLAQGGPYVGGKGERLPFADGAFDLVTEIDAVHHGDFPQAILRDMHRVLKPGGRMIVKDHDPDSFVRVVQAGLGDIRGNVSDKAEQFRIFTAYLKNLFRHGKEFALAAQTSPPAPDAVMKGSGRTDPRLSFKYLTPAMWTDMWNELNVDVTKKPFWYDYLPRQLAWLDLNHCLYVLEKPGTTPGVTG